MLRFMFMAAALAACAADPAASSGPEWCEADGFIGSDVRPTFYQYEPRPESMETFEATLDLGYPAICWEVWCGGTDIDRLCSGSAGS